MSLAAMDKEVLVGTSGPPSSSLTLASHLEEATVDLASANTVF